MGDMFNDIVAFVAEEDLVRALRKECHHVSGPAVQEGVILSTTAVLGALAEWLTEPRGQEWMRVELPSIDSSLEHVAELSANDGYHRFGQGLVSSLFGPGRDRVADQVAASAGLERHSAFVVLTTAAWITVGHLARLQTLSPRTDGLVAVLRKEDQDLRAAGWGPWIDAARAASGDMKSRRKLASHSTVQGRDSKPVGGDLGPIGGATERAAPRRRRRTVVGLLLLLAVVAGAAAFLGWSNRTEDQLATLDPEPDTDTDTDTDTAAADQAGEKVLEAGDDQAPSTASTASSSSSAPASPAGNTAQGGGQDNDGGSPEVPEVVEYSLALSDLQGTVDAGGTLDLTLNTATGSVCYDFDVTGLATPFAAHIHIGPSAGSGGITVDFGLLQGTDSGCLQAHPADVIAVASRPGIRYVEAHDPSGAFTIRSQLEQQVSTGPALQPVPELGDVAHAAIVGGAVVLRGNVADAETLEAIVESFADLESSSIEVLNELRIVPGAEPPSGRVIVEDSVLFGFDSTDLTDDASEVLAGMADILNVRPGWSVSAVGHTDSSGDVFHNFSLSLRRASAVQQALIDLGVSQLTVTVEGDGPLVPTASNETSAGRAENRRINFLVETG